MNYKSLISRVAAAIALVLIGGMPVLAADLKPRFNSLPQDYDFLQGRNVTQNGQTTDPVTATGGDSVDVIVYYHNTVVDSVAKNVRIKITMPDPSVARTTHVIKGQLSADNADTVSGTYVDGVETGKTDLTIKTDPSETKLSYVPGSVRWYPNRMNPNTSNGANLPGGQNGDNIIKDGITIGDLNGCFQYSGFVIFTVKLSGQPVPKALLSLTKEVRQASSDNVFATSMRTTPGNKVEYRITVRNNDGAGVAKNVRLKDTLPDGISYVGPTKLIRNGVESTLVDGITSSDGIVVVSDLKPQEQIQVTFTALTANSFANEACAVNSVTVNGENVGNTTNPATAETCFVVTPPATPTPVPPTLKPLPKPTPTPQLPKTGPGDTLTALGGLGVAAGTVGRYWSLKRSLRKAARSIDVA